MYAFWYGQLSPAKNYILYEHGDESSNHVELYDIHKDQRIELKQSVYKENDFSGISTALSPIGWLSDGSHFLINVTIDKGIEFEYRVMLFNLNKRNIVWKTKTEDWIMPSYFQQVDSKTALVKFANSGIIKKLSLKTGKISTAARIKGKSYSISPDKRKIAYFPESDSSKTNIKKICFHKIIIKTSDICLDLPRLTLANAYKGMGNHPPVWSTDGKFLYIPSENEVYVIQSPLNQ
ncbi:MAG: hypothetical protein OEZ34_09670 [Spirochaetia bacterium]|nr:hypothetical protein [Spirochaetia bacterium]